MTAVNVQTVDKDKQSEPLQQETMNLLNRVRARAFEFFEKRGGAPGNDLGDWLQAEKEVFHVPGTELVENDADFRVQLAVPGFDAKNIRVVALEDALIVEGESAHQHRETNGTVHFCEFGKRRMYRNIPLPGRVDPSRVSASLDKGVLHVRAAKEKDNLTRSAVA